MYEYKANYNDLISDFNLYLCERYGYRNACSVMWNANGICISIHKGSLDIYIRFWEYSEGVGNYPDWSIIIARCEFRDELREDRFELLKDLVRFFKEYMPRYGYKHLCTEDDDYKYYQMLNLPCIKRGFMGLATMELRSERLRCKYTYSKHSTPQESWPSCGVLKF